MATDLAAADARPWGTLVALYFIIIGLPSGIGLIAWLMARRGPGGAQFDRYANRVSLAALTVVGLLLVIDLGQPSRFYLMLTRFDNLGSPIAVGAKIIAVKTALLLVAIYAVERRRRGESAPDPGGAGPGASFQPIVRNSLAAASLALAIYPAAVLSHAWRSPLAGTSGAALLFLLTALVMGAGAAAVLVALAPPHLGVAELREPTQRLLVVLLASYTIVLVFEGLGVHGDPKLDALVAALVTGEYAVAWWGGVLAVGIAAPAAVLAALRPGRSALLAAALPAVAGACTARYLLFAVGE